MVDCTVYIDESGDLGYRCGTRWFVLSGVVVDIQTEPVIRNIINSIRNKLNMKEIHFRKIHSFDERCYVVDKLNECDFTYFNIIIDTDKSTLSQDSGASSTDNPRILLYNHACRFLLERVSWYLRDSGKNANVILSARGTSRDNDLIDYIKRLISEGTIQHINSGGVKAKSASKWDLLQLADVCATTSAKLFEFTPLGFRTPCFAYKLRNHLYTYNGQVSKYGLKYYNENMKPSEEFFKSNLICK